MVLSNKSFPKRSWFKVVLSVFYTCFITMQFLFTHRFDLVKKLAIFYSFGKYNRYVKVIAHRAKGFAKGSANIYTKKCWRGKYSILYDVLRAITILSLEWKLFFSHKTTIQQKCFFCLFLFIFCFQENSVDSFNDSLENWFELKTKKDD